MDKWFIKSGPGLLFVPTNWKGWLSLLVMVGLLTTTFYLNKAFSSAATIELRLRLMLEVVVILVVSVMFFDSHSQKKN